jgi:hypothetical protein
MKLHTHTVSEYGTIIRASCVVGAQQLQKGIGHLLLLAVCCLLCKWA